MDEYRSVTGACEFCGQTKVFELTEDEWLEKIRETNMKGDEIADIMATKECSCRLGSDWRHDQEIIDKTKENIEMMFQADYPEIAKIFQEMKIPIWHQNIKKITVTTPEHYTAIMERSKGTIKIRFKEITETELMATC